MTKEFIGFCGYKTNNKGAYNQHVQTCEKCKSYYSGSSTTSRVLRKLTRWGEAAKGSTDEEALGSAGFQYRILHKKNPKASDVAWFDAYQVALLGQEKR